MWRHVCTEGRSLLNPNHIDELIFLSQNTLRITHEWWDVVGLQWHFLDGASLSHCFSALVITSCIPQLHRVLAEQGFWKSRVSVCLLVCLSHRSTAATAAGGFATEHPAGRRLIAGASTYCLAAMHPHNNKFNTKTFRRYAYRPIYNTITPKVLETKQSFVYWYTRG